jgi:hypothetical protein
MRGLLMNRVVLISVFAAGLLVALSACGGSGSKSAQSTSTTAVTKTTATTAETNATTTTQGTATSQASTTGTATGTATPTTTAKTPRLPAVECQKLTRLASRMGQAFTGRTPAADSKAYADFLQQLAKTAPTDIRGDFRVLADAYTKIADAVAAVYNKPGATPTPDQLKKLENVGKELNQGEISRAATKVNAWLQQGCAR